MLLLVACDPEPVETPSTPSLAMAAAEVTFASQASLGPHRLEAAVRRDVTAAGGATRSTLESSILRWKDLDTWSIERRRDGRVVAETIVVDTVPWVRQGERFEQKRDAEPYRASLAQNWDPWLFAFEGVRHQLGLLPGEVETVDGRRALKHTLSLLPPPAGSRPTFTVTRAEGTVWIDEGTAVRLMGEVRVAASGRNQTSETTLTFAISEIGVEPVITPPVP